MGADYEITYYEEANGRCRTEEFLNSLEGHDTCEEKADALLLKLLQQGLGLRGTRFAKPLSGNRQGLWELIDHCSKRAIRFYYWRSGPKHFTIAWGELKEGREPSQDVLDYATECHSAWKSQQAQANAKRAKAPRRKKR